MRRTSILLDDRDFKAIEIVKERYGLATASDAIRLALRTLANTEGLKINAESIQDRVKTN